MFVRESPFSKTYPLVIREKESCATMVVERASVPSISNKENIHENSSNVNNFKQNAWQAAEKQASYVKERENKAKLEAKTAELRGSRAMAEKWWNSQFTLENEVDPMKHRRHALEIEKERTAKIISVPLPRSTCVEIQPTGKKSPGTATQNRPVIATYNVQRHNASEEMDACEKAALVTEMQKQNDEQKLQLDAKRDEDVQKRFHAAINKVRIEKEYTTTMDQLRKVGKQCQMRDALLASKAPPDRITMCPPVDKLIKADKQRRLEKGFEKVLPKTKEHAIEDLEGYKDELEEKYLAKPKTSLEKREQLQPRKETSSLNFDALLAPDSFEERYFLTRAKSIDDISPTDSLNMAYIDPSSPDKPPPLASSPISKIKPVAEIGKRDFGIQVDESMFPVTKGIQVNLLPLEQRYESPISGSSVDEVGRQEKLVSVGIQTDYVIIIDPAVTIPVSSTSASSYQSLPSKHDVPMFPYLFISQSGSDRSNDISASRIDAPEFYSLPSTSPEMDQPEFDTLRQKVEASLTRKRLKQKKYFPPLSARPSSETPMHLKQPRKHIESTPKKDAIFRTKTPVQRDIVSRTEPPAKKDVFQTEPTSQQDVFQAEPPAQQAVFRPEPPIQAIPLSEPIRDPYIVAASSFLAPVVAETTTRESTVTGSYADVNSIDVLNEIRRQISSRIDGVTTPILASDKVGVPSRDGKRVESTSPIPGVSTSQDIRYGRNDFRSFPMLPPRISEEPFDNSQSYLDIRKEELPNISMLANLSEVEISHASSLDDTKEQTSSAAAAAPPPTSIVADTIPSSSAVPSGLPSTRSTVNIENLKRVAAIIHKQMRNLHPALEDTPVEYRENQDDSQTSIPKVCWLRNGEPFVYHELSTIQEADSALADTTMKSNDDTKSESSSFNRLMDHIQKTTKEDIDTSRSSLITELSDLSHVLDGVYILPQSPGFNDLAESETKERQQKSTKDMVLDVPSPPSNSSDENIIRQSPMNLLVEKYGGGLSRRSSITPYYPQSSIKPSSSTSSGYLPADVDTTPPQSTSSRSVSQKSGLGERTSQSSSLDDLIPKLKIPSYPVEYSQVIDTLIRNYSLSPPPMFHLPSSRSHSDHDMKPVATTCVSDESKKRDISDVSQISLDLNQGDLTLTSAHDNRGPSTKSTLIAELASSSHSETERVKLRSPAFETPVLSPQQGSHVSTQSTCGSFQPLSLVASSTATSNDSEDLPFAQRPSMPISAEHIYDTVDINIAPNLLSPPQPSDVMSPLHYVAETESDSPKSKTLRPSSSIISKSSEDIDVVSVPASTDQAAPTSYKDGTAPPSTELPYASPPCATKHVPHDATETPSQFQPLTWHRMSSVDSSYGTQMEDMNTKQGSVETVTPSAIAPISDIAQSSKMVSSPYPAQISLPSSSGTGSFHPLVLVDASSVSSSSAKSGNKPGSTSSSLASESYKTVLHKAVARVSKDLLPSDFKLVQKKLHWRTAESSSSSSDESLSRMFTRSKIPHQSTPVKTTDGLPQVIPLSDAKEKETLSKSRHSFDSIEQARCFLSSDASKLVTEENQVKTLMKTTEMISVVIENDADEYRSPSAEGKMSQSMISFLQHEVSVLASPSDHVSLISENCLMASTLSQDAMKDQQQTPKMPSDTVEGFNASCSFTTPSYSYTPTVASVTEDFNTPHGTDTPSYSCTPTGLPFPSPSCSSTSKTSPWMPSEYRKRTKRLWNNLEEVKARQQVELKKKIMAQNKEKVKELQMKLRRKKKTPTPKKS